MESSDVDQLSARLGRMPLFSRIDRRALLAIAREMELIEIGKGGILIRQGDPADRMFVILEGSLEATITMEERRQQTIRRMREGDTVGEIALLAGGERTASVFATEDAVVAALSATALAHLVQENPEAAQELSGIVVERLRRSQLAMHMSRLFGVLELDALRDIEEAVEWIRLRSGEFLFHQGDPADAAYVLVSGRLRVAITDPTGKERTVNEVGRGEAVGEIALLTHGVRSATVYAIRESDLARFSRSAFETLTTKYPGAMIQMARLIGTRLQQVQSRGGGLPPPIESVALVSLDKTTDLGSVARRLAESIAPLANVRHVSSRVVDAELGRTGVADVAAEDPTSIRLTSWLGEQDLLHDFLVFEADQEWSRWTERIVRQADMVILIGNAVSDPHLREIEQHLSSSDPERRDLRQILVLLHPPDTARPTGTARWLDVREVEAHYHVRIDRRGDFERLGRILTGTSIGLVLGGGGARGFAHLGVYRALVEEGIPIDIVGGTSQGSIIASYVALGASPAEVLDVCRRHFTALFDYTLPVVSMIAGRRINRKLRTGFGEIDIEDLWIPFVCVSTNLSRAVQVIHRRGLLWKAVRASIALPGVMPPVYADGDLLVDGGLLNNIPADVVKSLGAGSLIAVDVTPEIDLSSSQPFEPEISGWSVLWNRIAPFVAKRTLPTMLTILTRSSVLASMQARNRLLNEQRADLYLQPPVGDWPMLDFDAIEAISERGYESTRARIREWRRNGMPGRR